MRRSIILGCAVSLAVAGCGSDPNGGDGSPVGDGGAKPDLAVKPPVFKIEPIPGCGQAGTQSVISVSGQKVAIASLATTTKTSSCMIPMRAPLDVPDFDVCYAESTGGAAFTTTVATSQPYLSVTGVGMALDPSGNPTIAFTGGGPAARRCGATELQITTAAGGVFSAPRTLFSMSQEGGLVPDQAAMCTMLQNVCNVGDCTGYWPAIAIDPQGVAAIVFRDIHFGSAMTDFGFSDVEFAQGPAYAGLTVDVSRGGGEYSRIAYTPAGKVAIVHYNGDGDISFKGIWINHELASGSWEAVQINNATIGEQLGFAVGKSGLHAVAYYDVKAERLEYVESMDGTTWPAAPTDIDTDGNTGQYPSLAFDADGEPAIAYYRCNDYLPNNTNCDFNKDGLMVARHTGGRWRTFRVTQQSAIQDGVYPAIGFVSDKAVIAFQTKAYDQGSGKNNLTLNLAREQ